MKTLLLLTLTACGTAAPTYREECDFSRQSYSAAVDPRFRELEQAIEIVRREDDRQALRRALGALKNTLAEDPGLTCSFVCVTDCDGALPALVASP